MSYVRLGRRRPHPILVIAGHWLAGRRASARAPLAERRLRIEGASAQSALSNVCALRQARQWLSRNSSGRYLVQTASRSPRPSTAERSVQPREDSGGHGNSSPHAVRVRRQATPLARPTAVTSTPRPSHRSFPTHCRWRTPRHPPTTRADQPDTRDALEPGCTATTHSSVSARC